MNSKFIFLLLASIALLGFSSCSKDEVDTTGSIYGIVSAAVSANTPIAGASVTINGKGLSKTTGNDGRYEFTDLEPGTYTLQVTANGYHPTTGQVTVVAGQNVSRDFQLDPGSTGVSLAPLTLTFGPSVEQLSFIITNGTNGSQTFSISGQPDFVEVTPASGTVAAKSQQAVQVHVKERSQITTNRSGQLTVNVGNNSYVISISVTNSVVTDPDAGKTGDDTGDNTGDNTGEQSGGTSGNIIVTRSLLAYYSFDDGSTVTNDHDPVAYNGQIYGSPDFVSGRNGKGKAIHFRKGDYVSIPENMLSGKRVYSIGFWLKDFGQGNLFLTQTNGEIKAPSIRVTSADQIQLAYDADGGFYYGWSSSVFTTDMSRFQSEAWHFIVVVRDASGKGYLYVDGVLMDTQTCGNEQVSEGAAMTIGSSTSDPMYVDNVRIHGTALSADDVKTIYSKEK